MPSSSIFWGTLPTRPRTSAGKPRPGGGRGEEGGVPSRCIKPAECWNLKPTAASYIYDLFHFGGGGERDQKLQDVIPKLGDGSLAADPTSIELSLTGAAAAATRGWGREEKGGGEKEGRRRG